MTSRRSEVPELTAARRSTRDRMRWPFRGRTWLWLAVAGPWLSATAVAWAAAGPTGDPQAIALARAEARAYTRIPAETYTQNGFIEMSDQEGSRSYLSYLWGQARLRPGWAWATEHGTIALSHGRVLWWRDQLTPPPCRAAGGCHQIPVELVAERAGAFWAFGDSASHTCFSPLRRGSTPVTVGQIADRIFGRFSAPVPGNGTVTLTYAFPYGRGATMRVTDIDSTSTHLTLSSRWVITGGHQTRSSYGYPLRAPAAPKVSRCA